MNSKDPQEKRYLRNKIIQRHKDLRMENDSAFQTQNKLLLRIHQKTGKPVKDILRDINEQE